MFMLCLKVTDEEENPSKSDCDSHLLKDTHPIIASSQYNGGNAEMYAPHGARLNNIPSAFHSGAWRASSNDMKPWIRIDLGRVRTVNGMSTKGHPMEASWTTRYHVNISEDGVNWKRLKNGEGNFQVRYQQTYHSDFINPLGTTGLLTLSLIGPYHELFSYLANHYKALKM